MAQGEATVVSAFETNVMMVRWPDVDLLNEALEARIFHKQTEDPDGLYRSNASGTWHSDDHLLKWTGKSGEVLQAMFAQAFARFGELHALEQGGSYDFSIQAWAMVTTDRGYATVHTHPNAHFSAVYYPRGLSDDAPEMMATGVGVKSGTLEFVDTRGPGNMAVKGLRLQPALRIQPEPGKMVVFPSYLPHFVHPYRGDDKRVSIAANATIRAYHPKKDQTT